jgi:AcrR family transcriptional regulator
MPGDRLPTRGDRSRRAILDSAHRLFIRQGYAATSMRQIAGRSHVALGGIYNHFSSKAEVFRAIVEERHPFLEILPILNSVTASTLDEYVRRSARTLVAELRNHPDFLNLMLIEIVEFKSSHVPRLFDRFSPLILPLAQRIDALDGNARRIPPLVLARAFLGMFFSYYITGILLVPAVTNKRQSDALDYFVDIFLHGVVGESA